MNTVFAFSLLPLILLCSFPVLEPVLCFRLAAETPFCNEMFASGAEKFLLGFLLDTRDFILQPNAGLTNRPWTVVFTYHLHVKRMVQWNRDKSLLSVKAALVTSYNRSNLRINWPAEQGSPGTISTGLSFGDGWTTEEGDYYKLLVLLPRPGTNTKERIVYKSQLFSAPPSTTHMQPWPVGPDYINCQEPECSMSAQHPPPPQSCLRWTAKTIAFLEQNGPF